MRTKTELPPGMAVGYRFYPTDEELIRDYLRPKLLENGSGVDHVIAEIDFCNFEPWDLPPKSKIKSRDPMWLFFSVQNLQLGRRKNSKKKTQTQTQTQTEDMIWKITGKRTTGTGYWKINSEEREIKDQDTGECIGKKKTLEFYNNHDETTNWAMQIYYIIPDNPLPKQRIYVLCRLKKKPNQEPKTPNRGEGKSSGAIASDVEKPVKPTAISSARGYEEVNHESLLTGAGDLEEHPEETVNRLIANPDANYYGDMTYCALDDCGPQTSWKRAHFEDGLAGSDTDTEGVDGRVKRSRLLALGENHSNS